MAAGGLSPFDGLHLGKSQNVKIGDLIGLETGQQTDLNMTLYNIVTHNKIHFSVISDIWFQKQNPSSAKGWVAGPDTPKMQALPEWGGV